MKSSSAIANFDNINPEDNKDDGQIEESPYTDKLVSDGLQNLLSFYKTKYSLISKEVCKLGVIIYKYSAKDKDNSHITSDDFEILMKNKKNFDENYLKLEKSKENYFEKMNELELFFRDNDNNNNNNIGCSHSSNLVGVFGKFKLCHFTSP